MEGSECHFTQHELCEPNPSQLTFFAVISRAFLGCTSCCSPINSFPCWVRKYWIPCLHIGATVCPGSAAWKFVERQAKAPVQLLSACHLAAAPFMRQHISGQQSILLSSLHKLGDQCLRTVILCELQPEHLSECPQRAQATCV